MRKLVILFVTAVLFGGVIWFNIGGLNARNNQAVCAVGVYANEKGVNAYSGGVNLGFASEITGIDVRTYTKNGGEGEVIGEFFKANLTNFNIDEFLARFGVLLTKQTQVGAVRNIYGMSARLPYRVKGLESNVHIAISGQNVTVASPIIMGSY